MPDTIRRDALAMAGSLDGTRWGLETAGERESNPRLAPLDEVHLGSLADDQPERRNHAKEQPRSSSA